MTIRSMIDAARAGNPAAFEKGFESVVAEKMNVAFESAKANTVRRMFGLAEEAESDIVQEAEVVDEEDTE